MFSLLARLFTPDPRRRVAPAPCTAVSEAIVIKTGLAEEFAGDGKRRLPFPFQEYGGARVTYIESLPDAKQAEVATALAKAFTLLESLEFSWLETSSLQTLEAIKLLCEGCPEVLVAIDPIHDISVFEEFLEKSHVFSASGRGQYLACFSQLLTLIPKGFLDYQDGFGFNFLMHVVKYQDIELLRHYLAEVKTLINKDFADLYTHFNVFCIVYSLKADDDRFSDKVNAILAALIDNGLLFRVDHLAAVLFLVEPISNGEIPYYNHKKAILAYYHYRGGRVHTPAQQKVLEAAVAKHSDLSNDAQVKAVLKSLKTGEPMTFLRAHHSFSTEEVSAGVEIVEPVLPGVVTAS